MFIFAITKDNKSTNGIDFELMALKPRMYFWHILKMALVILIVFYVFFAINRFFSNVFLVPEIQR